MMTEITVADLTQKVLNGSGVFDVLMQAATAHLSKEHESLRITGDHYATVYTSIITVMMQQSIEFLLAKGRLNLEKEINELQKDRLGAEIDLLLQKLVTEKAQVMDQTLLDPTANANTSFEVEEGVYLFNSVQPVAGVIGKKNEVMAKQIEGYNEDYKTKVARIYLETWKVAVTNLVDIGNLPDAGFADSNVQQLITSLLNDADLDFTP